MEVHPARQVWQGVMERVPVDVDMGRSEKEQTEEKNPQRHRGEERSVDHGGSPFLLLVRVERPNKVTYLEFFERKVHQCVYLLPSYQVEELMNTICEPGCVGAWRDPLKLQWPPH